MTMTTEDVIAAVAAYGLEPSAIPYTRAEPQPGQDHPGDRVFTFPLPLDDGRYLAVRWSFGQPSEDEIENWKLRWHSVDGPMTRAELEDSSRAR